MIEYYMVLSYCWCRTYQIFIGSTTAKRNL